jgi:hypothetical protein
MSKIFAAVIVRKYCGNTIIGFYSTKEKAEQAAKDYIEETLTRWEKEAIEKVKTHGSAYAFTRDPAGNDFWYEIDPVTVDTLYDGPGYLYWDGDDGG